MTDLQRRSAVTTEMLQRYLEGTLRQRAIQPSVIPRRAPGGTIPLSFGQEQIWLVAQLAPGSTAYNECITIHMPGPLSLEAFERSLNAIVARHDAWRTSFPLVDGAPVQRVHPAATIPLPVVDLRHLPVAEREQTATQLATDAAMPPFDLAHGPLFRALLVRMADEEHRLYLALHHIIFDGVSVYQVFLPELRATYEALLAGQPAPLPELPIQYPDYAQWQRQYVTPEVIADHLAYWKRQLQGAPALLELPTDRPRTSAPTFHGSMHPFALGQQLTLALKEVCRREGVTLYMALVAAFSALLYCYTGQEDILLGTATAGRRRPEVQHLLGFFLNTVVLRADLSGNPSFRTLLRRVREVVIDAQSHDEIPFERLVQELAPDRGLGRNPLFQVMISLEPPLPALESGWTLTQMDVEVHKAKFDLSLELDDRPEGIVGRLEYSSDLFEAETIARMATHWRALLDSMVADPARRLSELPLVTEAERQQLAAWNATTVDYPRDRCIHHLFEAQVERTPTAVAAECQGQEARLTYGDLNRRANQLAHYLRRLGVGPDVPVGLCVERTLDMLVCLLGILKAGGYYVPLDPTYPHERLAFILHDTQAPIVLTQQRLKDVLPATQARVICLESDARALAAERDDNPVSGASAENLAYVMYTSGSTGKPKGVEVRHRSISRLVFGADYARLDASRVILHMAPISFDASTFEVWGALLHGARCVLLPARVPTPRDIQAAIREHGVTTAWFTASLFNAIIDEAPDALRGIEQVLTGGEALSVGHIRRAQRALPATEFINGYGPTEGTTFTTCYRIPRDLDAATRSIPIGRPIGNTRVYLLDDHLRPVPVGVPGELYIGGDGLARGYRNRPDLTAEKFIRDPFSEAPDARLYKTGDLARYLPDGNIEFLGRRDLQVKLHGFRIELGEIETVLTAHPDVLEAVVLAREDAPGRKHLVAYVVTRPTATPTADDLRGDLRDDLRDDLCRYLTARLPQYMIPSAFVTLDALPVTPNGKVDRAALPAPAATHAATPTATAPHTPAEQTLARIWADVLHLEQVGVYDNFFELGGDSLLCIRILARAAEAGMQLTARDMFAHQTIAELAETVRAQTRMSDGSGGVAASDSGGATRGPHRVAPAAPADGEQRPSIALAHAEDHKHARVGERSVLVPLREGGTRRPFFYVDIAPTEVSLFCLRLARDLGPEQPFYALEMCATPWVPRTVEELAAEHVRALRGVQPTGPYLLGGFCAGGVVAFEIAQQLRAVGEQVDLLLLLEATTDSVGCIRTQALRGAVTCLGALLGQGIERQLEWFLFLRKVYHTTRRAYLRVRGRQRPQAPRSHSGSAGGDEPGGAQALAFVPSRRSKVRRIRDALPGFGANLSPAAVLSKDNGGLFKWVSAHYALRPYAGKVTLVRAREERLSVPRDLTSGWGAIAREVEVHDVPGNHRSFRYEYVVATADLVGRCLAEAQVVGAR